MKGAIETRWCVFTGAPASGKSTTLAALKACGYLVVEEAGRAYLEELERTGIPVDRAALEFQYAVLDRIKAAESTLPSDALIFFDRALPDAIGYFRHHGIPLGTIVEDCRVRRYHRIFFFERLTHASADAVRTESERERQSLEAQLLTGYRMLGYEPSIVTNAPLEERIAFILGCLDD